MVRIGTSPPRWNTPVAVCAQSNAMSASLSPIMKLGRSDHVGHKAEMGAGEQGSADCWLRLTSNGAAAGSAYLRGLQDSSNEMER